MSWRKIDCVEVFAQMRYLIQPIILTHKSVWLKQNLNKNVIKIKELKINSHRNLTDFSIYSNM